jgi:tRNA 2-thiouridine synthesizing protein D
MADSIVVLITKPPYGMEEGFAGLRLSLAMLVSGLVERSTIMLVGEGTLNAVASQQPEAIGMPSNLEAIQDLVDFEAEIYCVEEDLMEWASGAEVSNMVKMVSWEEARDILDAHELVTTF